MKGAAHLAADRKSPTAQLVAAESPHNTPRPFLSVILVYGTHIR